MECKLSTFGCLSLYVAPGSPVQKLFCHYLFILFFSLKYCKNVLAVITTCKYNHLFINLYLYQCLLSPSHLPALFLVTSLNPIDHPDLTNSLELPAECIPLSAHMLLIHQYCYAFNFSPPLFLLPLPCWHCKKRIPLMGPEPLSLHTPDSNPGCNRHLTTSRK